MNRTARPKILAVLTIWLFSGQYAFAADWLTKPEIKNLLSGNTAKGHYQRRAESTARMVEVGIEIRFFGDGTAEQKSERFLASKGTYTEQGKWFVNKKGRLCTIWQPRNKKICRRVKREGNGNYALVGKKNTVEFKVIPGT